MIHGGLYILQDCDSGVYYTNSKGKYGNHWTNKLDDAKIFKLRTGLKRTAKKFPERNLQIREVYLCVIEKVEKL